MHKFSNNYIFSGKNFICKLDKQLIILWSLDTAWVPQFDRLDLNNLKTP